jgi:hypothetical protein
MPSFRDLPEEQFDNMVEFLAMLKETEGGDMKNNPSPAGTPAE